ncbi:MAG TPA: transposase, partial [Porphyromonadaceae bacterium]|nr:transposase [Porphyromonadaceae bacterium]
MATFKPIVSSYKKSDGTRAVMIYVFHNGKKRYPNTNFFLSKEDFTKSLKIKNQKYIDDLDKIVKRCRDRCNQNATKIGSMDVDQVVKLVSDIIEGRDAPETSFQLDFIKYGRDYVKALNKKGHTGNARTYTVALNNLAKFIGGETLDVNEINTRFVNKWIQWIKDQPPRTGRKKGGRAESLYPANIKALHEFAKKEYNEEEIGQIRIPLSPFKKADIPKLPPQRKRALSVYQIRKVFSLKDIQTSHVGTNKYNFARDVSMLSFLLIGMNLADLYNCKNYKNGRITYKRTKVRKRRSDEGLYSIKVVPEAINLVNKYRDPEGKRVFCFYKMYASMDTFTAAVNGRYRKGAKGELYSTGLKKIGIEIGEDDLEHYAFRHSWATIATNKVGINIFDVHRALNHVVDEMKVTEL